MFRVFLLLLKRLRSLLARIAKVCSFSHPKELFISFSVFFLLGLFSINICFSQIVKEIKTSQPPAISKNLSEQDIVETISSFKTDDPAKSVKIFKEKLLKSVPTEKTRQKVTRDILKDIGKIRVVDSELEKKVKDLITPVLSLYGKRKSYDIIIANHKTSFIMSYSGVVIIFTTQLFLEAQSDDEILGYVAHEIGHEYFDKYSRFTEHLFKIVHTEGNGEPALSRHFGNVLAILELQCDAFASITLAHLRYDSLAFIDGLERMQKIYPVNPNAYHPKIEMRRRVVQEVIPKKLNGAPKREVSSLFKEIKQAVSE